MHINSDALRSVRRLEREFQVDTLSSSLQVFDPEDHASLHSDKFKEGLSIYGVSQPVIGTSVV